VKKRSLSNLIGAVILISATLIGGVFVYGYFQRSLKSMESMGQGIEVLASSELVANGSKVVYIKIINDMPNSIKVLGVYGVFNNGSIQNLSLANKIDPDVIQKEIPQGEGLSFIFYVAPSVQSVFIKYSYLPTGQVMSSQAVKLG